MIIFFHRDVFFTVELQRKITYRCDVKQMTSQKIYYPDVLSAKYILESKRLLFIKITNFVTGS